MPSQLLADKYKVFLYMIEIFIKDVNINPDRVNILKSDYLSVHIKFLDLPNLIIKQSKFINSTIENTTNKQSGIFKFDSGKSCIFLKRPGDFSKNIKNNPLKLEIHELISDPCYENDDDEPFGKTAINLSGCLCDQFNMATNDQDHLPDPYELRDNYELFDRDKNLLGTVNVFLRITCYGNCLMTKFSTKDNKFFFKNSDSSSEFQCLRLLTEKQRILEKYKEKICVPEHYSESENADPKPRTILGLSAACTDYSKRLGNHSAPSKYPEIDQMKEENALINKKIEKLQIIDECNEFKNPMKHFTSSSSIYHRMLCPSSQMFENRLKSKNLSTNLSNNEDELRFKRMRGGGIDEKWKKSPVLPLLSVEALVSGACRSKKEDGAPGCGCYGKSGTGIMKSGLGCLNRPCPGIDCLIRAFRETQEFVDSIGKVPGMQGLGLMDPAESPYFNRDRGLTTSCVEKKPINSLHEQKQFNPLEGSSKFVDQRDDPFDNPELVTKSYQKTVMLPEKTWKDEQSDGGELEDSFLLIEDDYDENFQKSDRKSLNDFSYFSEDFSSPKSPLKPSKKLQKLPKMKSNHIKMHRQQLKNSQRVNEPPKRVQISKRIMKLVQSTRSGFCHGHKDCVDVRVRVPGNMGWLWNTQETYGALKPKVGWKPGAISRRVWNILEDVKMDRASASEERDRPLTPTPVRGKRLKGAKRKHLFFPSRTWGKMNTTEFQLPPTLHIHRKNGDYYVTFYPVSKDLINKPEEQQLVKPLYFEIKRDKHINADNNSGDISSVPSDMEIEFSPPAAVTRYREKINTRDFDTQVQQDKIIEAINEIFPVHIEETKPKAKIVKKKKKKK